MVAVTPAAPIGPIPSLAQAEAYLIDAEARNPGAWVPHSRYVAEAARIIAGRIAGLDPEQAYILGLLHDIGRRAGVAGMRHVIDGYRFLMEQGFDGAARICLTHSYPIKLVDSGSAWDGTPEEYDFVQAYLDQVEYCLYDRLVQLCDSISMPEGYCLLEVRMVDVALRYGVNEYTVPKWKSFFVVKEEFERLFGCSVYSVLPRVVENTFGIPAPTLPIKSFHAK